MNRPRLLALAACILTGPLSAQQPPPQRLESLARDQALRLSRYRQDYPALFVAAFRQLAHLAKGESPDSSPSVYCLAIGGALPQLGLTIADPTPGISAQLSDLALIVRPFSACRVNPNRMSRRTIIDTATGDTAELLTVEHVLFRTPTKVELRLSKYVGPEWAKTWSCEAARTGEQWRVSRCKLVGWS